MTSPVVPDASVVVKWLLREPDSPKAVALLRSGRELHAPELLRVEASAAIVRRCREGLILVGDARRRLAFAARLLSERRVGYATDAALLPRAWEIALQIKHPLQDCLYIACAERLGADLVTADLQFVARAAADFPCVKTL
jgi:predicted nucleic acid-binding protein